MESMRLDRNFDEMLLERDASIATKDDHEDHRAASEMFFDLANVNDVCASVSRCGGQIRIAQDLSPHLPHSGGIIWETSYMLSQYMRDHFLLGDDASSTEHRSASRDSEEAMCARQKEKDALLNSTTNGRLRGARKIASVLELGAGCGYVGISLGNAFQGAIKVVVTDQPCAMENLRRNVEANNRYGNIEAKPLAWGADRLTIRSMHTRGKDASTNQSHGGAKGAPSQDDAHERALGGADTHEPQRAPRTFDYILATDVIFDVALVRPLVETMRQHSHAHTIIYILAQRREADAHELFLRLIRDVYEKVEELPLVFKDNPVLEKCARELECLLFRFSGCRE